VWVVQGNTYTTYRSVFIPRHELDDSKSALDVQSTSLDLQVIRFVVELGEFMFIIGLGKLKFIVVLGKLASSTFHHLYMTDLATIPSVSPSYRRFLLDAMFAASTEPPTIDLWNVRAPRLL
jgi:hypothetical protein